MLLKTHRSGLKSHHIGLWRPLSPCTIKWLSLPDGNNFFRSEKPILIKVSTKHLMRCIWGLFIFLHTAYLLEEYNLQDSYWRSDPPWKRPEQDEPLHLTPAVCNKSFQYPVWMQVIFKSFLSEESGSTFLSRCPTTCPCLAKIVLSQAIKVFVLIKISDTNYCLCKNSQWT